MGRVLFSRVRGRDGGWHAAGGPAAGAWRAQRPRPRASDGPLALLLRVRFSPRPVSTAPSSSRGRGRARVGEPRRRTGGPPQVSRQGFRLVPAGRGWWFRCDAPRAARSGAAGSHGGPSASSFPMTCPGFVQLTLTPAQQQLLLQQAQAQAQLLAAAVQQHSASQQHSAAGATISASAATPMTQIPLSQPIQIAQVSERAPRGAPWSLLPRPRNNTVVCLFESRS